MSYQELIYASSNEWFVVNVNVMSLMLTCCVNVSFRRSVGRRQSDPLELDRWRFARRGTEPDYRSLQGRQDAVHSGT